MQRCSTCQRHVRAEESACPFCQAALRLAVGGALILAAGCTSVAIPAYGTPAPLPTASVKPSPTPTPDAPMPVYGAPAPQQ